MTIVGLSVIGITLEEIEVTSVSLSQSVIMIKSFISIILYGIEIE